MTQIERASIISDLKTVCIFLSCASDQDEFSTNAWVAVNALIRKIGGEEMTAIDVLNKISECVRGIAASGERTTSIIDIQRACKLPIMSHSEKIYTARMLMSRGYQRKLQYGPDGKGSWYYFKTKSLPGHTPPILPE